MFVEVCTCGVLLLVPGMLVGCFLLVMCPLMNRSRCWLCGGYSNYGVFGQSIHAPI